MTNTGWPEEPSTCLIGCTVLAPLERVCTGTVGSAKDALLTGAGGWYCRGGAMLAERIGTVTVGLRKLEAAGEEAGVAPAR